MTEEKPEVVEVTARGGTKNERGRVLDEIAEILAEDNYFRIARGESETETTDTHQYEKPSDD